MVVLGIDPGLTTGISLVKVSAKVEVIESHSIFSSDLLNGLEDTRLKRLSSKAELGVIETTPIPTVGRMNKTLAAVVRYLENELGDLGLNIIFVSPGAWKTTRIGQMPRKDLFSSWEPMTIHEEDAARMATISAVAILRDRKEKTEV